MATVTDRDMTSEHLIELLERSELVGLALVVGPLGLSATAVDEDGSPDHSVAAFHGGKERFACAELFVRLPELVAELVAARKVVRAAGSVLAIQSEWEDTHDSEGVALYNVDFDHTEWCVRRDAANDELAAAHGR